MSDGEMWDELFKRVEELKHTLRREQAKDVLETLEMQGKVVDMVKITAERVKSVEDQSNDNFILALSAFLLGFSVGAVESSNPRKFKDTWVQHLKKQGLSTEVTNLLERWMIAICEAGEKP